MWSTAIEDFNIQIVANITFLSILKILEPDTLDLPNKGLKTRII